MYPMLMFPFHFKATVIPTATVHQDQESAGDSERSEETVGKQKGMEEGQMEEEERMKESAPEQGNGNLV